MRDPSCLRDGHPGLNPARMWEFRSSKILQQFVLAFPTVVFTLGGHASLEQPPSAVPFGEDFYTEFLILISAIFVVVAACQKGACFETEWALATSFPGLAHLASSCAHPKGFRPRWGSKQHAGGSYLSGDTAEYT